MSKKILISIFIIIAIIIGCISFFSFKKEQELKQAINACTSQANQLCTEYNFENASIKINLYADEAYLLTIDGILANEDLNNIYNFVTKIEQLRINYEDYFLLTQITINGDRYGIDYNNRNKLERNHLVVYIYRTEEELERLEDLKNQLPYEGMSEDDINNTMLGTPDEKEYGFGYNEVSASHKWVQYIWRDDNGELQAKATVRYWDFKNRKQVEGYVSDVFYWGEYYDINK